MQHLKLSRSNGDEAVSPVVGVMLMLIVTIIIAAVVSGFAGGLIGNPSQNAPTLDMDVKVVNMGSWTASGFFATVTSVNKPIQTSDIEIVTNWTAADGVSGGSTIIPFPGTAYVSGDNWMLTSGYSKYVNTNCLLGGGASNSQNANYHWIAPWGGGPGVNGSVALGYGDTNANTYGQVSQQFGVYMLVPGTTMTAKPEGQGAGRNIGGTPGSSSESGGYGVSTPYTYSGPTCTDATMAVFGTGWQNLQEGDKVNVKVIYTPTGSVIFNKNVPVTEG